MRTMPNGSNRTARWVAPGRVRTRAAPLVLLVLATALTVGLAAAGCGGKPRAQAAKKFVIANGGSDTMVNLAQMWSEEYHKVNPNVSIEVAGGGSGVGIRDLIQGIVAIANCSRDMTEAEKAQARKNTGKDPVEWVVGYDGIAIYAHKDSPVEQLTIEELAGIYGEGGKIANWSQLGVNLKAADGSDKIVRVSRQNSSGTYAYFRENVLDKKDFKLGSKDMSGSKDVVELVSRTKCAIGYSGMGYATEGVKMIKLAAKNGDEGCVPSVENVAVGKYPLSRSLLLYTLGRPEGDVKAYLEWALSPAGQKIVKEAGYIPISAVPKNIEI
ncbi:MAG: phosphate ABC transporter substrate-binding protein [Verrucomicrobiota bacterium]|nr:phosphate ABC transporter substrate-binding protein [Verrucomicrobiota bacterium]